MGTLLATMPNGAVHEREMSRPERYSHGLAIKRGSEWILLSVHSSHKLASKSLNRLERCFSGGPAFGDYPEIEVVPLGQKLPKKCSPSHIAELDHSQTSFMVLQSSST